MQLREEARITQGPTVTSGYKRRQVENANLATALPPLEEASFSEVPRAVLQLWATCFLLPSPSPHSPTLPLLTLHKGELGARRIIMAFAIESTTSVKNQVNQVGLNKKKMFLKQHQLRRSLLLNSSPWMPSQGRCSENFIFNKLSGELC